MISDNSDFIFNLGSVETHPAELFGCYKPGFVGDEIFIPMGSTIGLGNLQFISSQWYTLVWGNHHHWSTSFFSAPGFTGITACFYLRPCSTCCGISWRGWPCTSGRWATRKSVPRRWCSVLVKTHWIGGRGHLNGKPCFFTCFYHWIWIFPVDSQLKPERKACVRFWQSARAKFQRCVFFPCFSRISCIVSGLSTHSCG